jgi:hypothetical protein
MEIKFHGTYEKDLFFRAVRVANQPRGNRRFIAPFMLVAAVVAAAVLVNRIIESGDVMGNASYIAVVMILAAFVIRSYFGYYWAARRMWKNPALQIPLTGYVNQNGITYELEDDQKNEIPWTRYHRVRKTHELIALVTRDGLLTIFPRSFFKSDVSWRKFSQLVDKKIISMS